MITSLNSSDSSLGFRVDEHLSYLLCLPFCSLPISRFWVTYRPVLLRHYAQSSPIMKRQGTNQHVNSLMNRSSEFIQSYVT